MSEHGGFRKGAGRKKSIPTTVIRVPKVFREIIKEFIEFDHFDFNFECYINHIVAEQWLWCDQLTTIAMRIPVEENLNIKFFCTEVRGIFELFDDVVDHIGGVDKAYKLYKSCDTEEGFFAALDFDMRAYWSCEFTISKLSVINDAVLKGFYSQPSTVTTIKVNGEV